MVFTLYWNPFSGSLAPMAVLEEIGAPYEKVLINFEKGEHLTAEYLKIHPLGLVPSLRLTDGRYVFESAGICMFLVDRYPAYELAPPADHPDRAFFNQWMLFFADAIYPVYGRFGHPERYSTDPSHAPAIKAASIHHLNQQWTVVEDALKHQSWILGERFSAADIYLQMLSTWNEDNNAFRRMFPNVARVADETMKRPGVHRAIRLHKH